MTRELENLLAKRFIQRSDVKAVQTTDGKYIPDVKFESGKYGHGFNRQSLQDHLNGVHSYGHYLLDEHDLCKLMVFDIDLRDTTPKEGQEPPEPGSWVNLPWVSDAPNITDEQYEAWCQAYTDVNPYLLWRNRRAQAERKWYKYQMRMLAQRICGVIQNELGLDTAAAYSGHKGIHVYGFTGSLPATEVRAGAELVLEILSDFQPVRGRNFYRHIDPDPVTGFRNFDVEVFPKQTTLGEKSYGNLVRLPLGKNFKAPKDPTFFLDFSAPMSEFKPHPNPVALLTSGNPFGDA